MREMLHDNINSFMGACFDTASPCFLFHYCPKGSLLVSSFSQEQLYQIPCLWLTSIYKFAHIMYTTKAFVFIRT